MKLCMGCMNQMEDQVTVCPHCGFNERELKQEAYYLTPGTVVGGKYIIGRALSYAGYTVTYIGMDAENNRKVLVKEYLPNEFSTRSEGDKEVTIYSGDAKEQFEEGLTTFLNEANRIQQLGRPQGIMQVYDCVAENDTGYVISEYLEGQTLAQILEGGKKFSPQEAKEFICEILEGLRRVHPLDVVHCDIAPETILVTRTGEIKLLDFGATRYVTTANSKSLAIILKQGYAPEEQYRSQGVRGPWTDVYALGAVMYHMITGIVPIESVDRALVDELKAPSQLGVPMPKNMENALMNALNVYQKDRTPSAEVFYQELNSDEVKRIQVKKQKYETGRFPKWAKVLVAGVLCVVVAGGVVVVGKGLGRKLEAEKPKEVKTAKNVIGMSEAEANEELKSEGVRFEADKVFFEKGFKENEGKSEILTQEPAAGQEMSEDDPVIRGAVRSSEKCTYEDIADYEQDVKRIGKEFGINTVKDSENEDKAWGTLFGIVLKDGTKIVTSELQEKSVLTLSQVDCLLQYNGEYFYEKKLKNYKKKYKYIDNVEMKKYKDKKKGATGEGYPPCIKPYYSFDEREGFIAEQLVEPGKEYDSGRDGTLFALVKEKIEYNHQNVSELIKRLKDSNFKVHEKGKGDEVDYIEVEAKGGCKYFKKRDKITIHKKESPTERPKQSEPQSQNENKRPKIEQDTIPWE